MASENPDVVSPVVKNKEPLESEFSEKLVIEKEKNEGSKKMIVLKTFGGETFEIDEAVALQSKTIAHLVEDNCADDEIPLANVTGPILSKVIEYCKKHLEVGDSDEEALKKWDAEFMDTDQATICQLIMASNYLNIKGLLDLACQTVADMIIACGTPEKMREKFGIINDYTTEEEDEIRKENPWCYE